MNVKGIAGTCIIAVMLIFTGCSNKAGRYYEDGMTAYEDGNYSEAVTLFASAAEANPDKAEYLINYGFALIGTGECDKAESAFLGAVLEKDIKMVKENNKQAYRGAGIACYMNSDYETAIEYFDKALEYTVLEELDIDILLYKAASYEESKDISKALDVYNELFEKGKDTAALHHIKADVLRKQEKYEESLEEYNKALEFEKDNFSLYFGKYAVLAELGREEEARQVLDRAEEIEVFDNAGLFDVGKVHFYQKNYEAALIELGQAADKGYSEAWYYLAEINMNKGSYEEALKNYELYLAAKNKPNAAMYIQMSTCYLMLGEYEMAGEYITLAASYNDSSIRQAYVRNNIIYLERMGQFEEAHELLTRYIKLYPEDEEALKELIYIETRTDTE